MRVYRIPFAVLALDTQLVLVERQRERERGISRERERERQRDREGEREREREIRTAHNICSYFDSIELVCAL